MTLTATEMLHCQSLKIPHNLDRDGIAYPATYCEKTMIEFAKKHVKAALESAAKNALLKDQGHYILGDEDWHEDWFVNKDSILNAYPESLII